MVWNLDRREWKCAFAFVIGGRESSRDARLEIKDGDERRS